VVKDALDKDPNHIGLGVLHEPTGNTCVLPFDQSGGLGHVGLVRTLKVPRQECKGFVIQKNPDGTFAVKNFSGLNGPQGQPGSTRMPQATFDEITKALQAAGL
jgi:hypothetical protein